MRNLPHEAVEQDVSIGDWLRMTFGDAPAPRNVLSAMMHGIYGGNLDKLSFPSVMPAFWYNFHLEKGVDEVLIPRGDYELLKELDPRKRGIEEEVRAWSKAEVISFPDGMGSLASAIRDELEKKANVVLKPSTPVSKLRYISDQNKVELSTTSEPPSLHDKVISTTPSGLLAPTLPSPIPLNTRAVTMRTVSFFFPQPNLTTNLTGFGYLVPLTSPNPEQILGMFFDSDTYGLHDDEKRGTKVTVLMGGHFWSELSEQEMPGEEECVRRARQVLARHVGITQKPEMTHVGLASGCIPQHVVSHRATMTAADEALRSQFKGTLAVAGGSYTAVGVMPAMRAGYDVACEVAGVGERGETVGDTGLAQFRGRQGADVIAVPREELNALGKQLRGSSAVGRWFSGR